MSQLDSQVSIALQTSKSLLATPQWLAAFLATQRPSTPLPALVQTATFRLLASDITSTLVASTSTCFPEEITNAAVKERRLQGVVMAQVLAVEDMSKSRWEQIEAIEALERGEGTKGREIVRVVAVPEEGGEDATRGGAEGVRRGGGVHKLLLQDAAGRMVWGIEVEDVEGVGVGMSIGCKVLLRGNLVARGVVLLEPATATVAGGKIEELHTKWKEGRKAELKAELKAQVEAAGGGAKG